MMEVIAATTTATMEEVIGAMTTATMEEVIAQQATTIATMEEVILIVRHKSSSNHSNNDHAENVIIVATIPVVVTMGHLHQHQQVAVEHLHQHQQVAVEHLHQLDNYIWHIYDNSLQYTKYLDGGRNELTANNFQGSEYNVMSALPYQFRICLVTL